MHNSIRDEHMDQLCEAIVKLESIDECYALFEDLFTVTELLSIKQRFWVAQLLQNKHIYTDIVKQTGASTATISRVNRCLTYGSGGYTKALERVEKKK